MSKNWPFRSVSKDLLSVTEYNAMQTLSIARNYDLIIDEFLHDGHKQIKEIIVKTDPDFVSLKEDVRKLENSTTVSYVFFSILLKNLVN